MFEAKLILDGGEPIEVLQCSYHMDRDTDKSGMPATGVHGGKISLTIKSSSDITLFDWMINAFAQKKGEIEFYKRNDPTPAKVLAFENAYIIEHGESFNVLDGNRDQPMVEHFTVSAETMKMQDSELKKVWVS
ncbi:type VI secretion system tube protein TssD [Lewinella sp. IMCC34183]|uniref:type VI secretion system tube protein TssD n=1 Tax=Lewinella sp. IMCC34183 TaxID=2248762 RepID=UPI000E2287D5|nr:type VI secretion system tube protein TssD [Lewinella sp. IMCC34183]